MSERQDRNYDGEMMTKGKVGEGNVKEWLESKGYTVIDVSENKFMQMLDVDIVFAIPSGKSFLSEVKSDYYLPKTKNICFETERIYHQAGRFEHGWAVKSPADYLFYTTPETGEVYVFKFSELRDRVAQYIKKTGRHIRCSVVETDNGKTTHNFLIPISELEGIYTLEKMNIQEGENHV